MTKETAFHPRWSQLTRNVTEYRGYWLPTCFTNQGAVAEYWACREKAAVMDLSPLRKWEVLGPDAEALMQDAITRDVRRLADGQVVYTAMCNETGGMIDDATVFRLGRRQLPLRRRRRVRRRAPQGLAERLGLRVWVKPSTDELHNIAVQGPLSREILERDHLDARRTQPQLEELQAGSASSIGRIGDYDGIPLIVSRTGYSGELGYEIFCHPSDGAGGLGRGHGGGRAARADAARPRRARHAAHRVRPDLRRLRVRRPGRPVRGRHRLHRSTSTSTRTSSARRR